MYAASPQRKALQWLRLCSRNSASPHSSYIKRSPAIQVPDLSCRMQECRANSHSRSCGGRSEADVSNSSFVPNLQKSIDEEVERLRDRQGESKDSGVDKKRERVLPIVKVVMLVAIVGFVGAL